MIHDEPFTFTRAFVTGGRDFTDYQRIEDDFRALIPLGLSRVAEGQCPFGGADDHAYDAWHLLRNESTQRYPMRRDLDGPGKQAYLRRNERMLDEERPDLGLGYPTAKSRGTWHCLSEALKRGIPVAVWVPWGDAYDVFCEGLGAYLQGAVCTRASGRRVIAGPVTWRGDRFALFATRLGNLLGG